MVSDSFGFDVKMVHIMIFTDGTVTIYQLQRVLHIQDIQDNGRESLLLYRVRCYCNVDVLSV